MQTVFVDTAFWIALLVKQDQYHELAKRWSMALSGRMVTSVAVLIETANGLARPTSRRAAMTLMDHLYERSDVTIVALTEDLWKRGRDLYRDRPDKSWSLTDCISFLIMHDLDIGEALTSDEHFKQAGFRALLHDHP